MSLEFIDVDTGLPLLEKVISETRTYFIDFTEKIRNAEIANINSISTTPLGRVTSASALNVSNYGIDGDAVFFSISGGTAGEVYRVTARVLDSSGQTLEGSGALLLTSY